MDRDEDQRLPTELAKLTARIREERPALSALELDRLKLQIHGRMTSRSTRKGALMRSRLAITLMLLLGVFLTAGGSGLAVTGISGSQNASVAQYGDDDDDDDDDDDEDDEDVDVEPALSVLGAQSDPPPPPPPEQGVLPETARENAVQPARQVQSGGARNLPFTGYAAIPILLTGIVLLALGLVAQRRVGIERGME